MAFDIDYNASLSFSQMKDRRGKFCGLRGGEGGGGEWKEKIEREVADSWSKI